MGRSTKLLRSSSLKSIFRSNEKFFLYIWPALKVNLTIKVNHKNKFQKKQSNITFTELYMKN